MGVPVYTFQRRKTVKKPPVQNDIEYYTSVGNMSSETDWSKYIFFLLLVIIVLLGLLTVMVYRKGIPVKLRA